MRTTIRMKPDLARRAKAFAKKTDRTFTELVEDAVADLLAHQQPMAKLPSIPTVKGPTQLSATSIKKALADMYDEDAAALRKKKK